MNSFLVWIHNNAKSVEHVDTIYTCDKKSGDMTIFYEKNNSCDT